MSQSGFYFYPGDWLKDTRVLTLQCRGAWIDLLGELNEHAGSVSWLIADFARFWGCDESTADGIVQELSRLKIANVTRDGHGVVTVMSRRLSRELKVRENTKLRKQVERERKRVTRDGHGVVTAENHSSSYPSPSPSPSPSLNSFGYFWAAYPKKKSKGDAEKAWKVLKPDSNLATDILEAVIYWSQSPDWQKDAGQFVPYPATWLRRRGWEDEQNKAIRLVPLVGEDHGQHRARPLPTLVQRDPEPTKDERAKVQALLKDLTEKL